MIEQPLRRHALLLAGCVAFVALARRFARRL
jgi:hypothetical protein